jgi:hypothetical protein
MATARPLVEGVYLPTSLTAMYTAVQPVVVTKVTLTNQAGSAVTVTLSIVPSGATPANNHRIAHGSSFSIPGNGKPFNVPDMHHNLKVGDTIQALASSSNAVSMRASGLLL